MEPWEGFRQATRARIGLPRAGDAWTTATLLDFTLAHARARDAVHGVVNFAAVATSLAPVETQIVASQAIDRDSYLRRPDLGRRLDAGSRAVLAPGRWEAVLVIADGLSAFAVQAHAALVAKATLERLDGWAVAPIILARQGRVALADEIGEALGAAISVVLIGERPGLTVQDSLGAYLTFGPRVGRTDAERNCISNIHADGLSHEAAADRLAWLMQQVRQLRLSGVALKEDAPTALPRPR
jgi:ethanolamine ammonia-lyase small subunit